MEERCVICGEIIPEGRQVCPKCEAGHEKPRVSDEKLRKAKNRIAAQIALAKEIGSDFITLTVGNGKTILKALEEQGNSNATDREGKTWTD